MDIKKILIIISSIILLAIISIFTFNNFVVIDIDQIDTTDISLSTVICEIDEDCKDFGDSFCHESNVCAKEIELITQPLGGFEQ